MKILKVLNWPITLSSLSLISIGTLVIYSSSKELAFQQLVFTGVGFIFFLLLSQFDIHALAKFVKPLYLLIILLLAVVAILGVETRGAIRWIPLGFFNIQPSEFAKPVLILILAQFWMKNPPSWINIFKSLGFSLPILLLVFRQPDLGTTLTLIAIWTGMLFASRVSVKKLVILTIVACLIFPSGWLFLKDYQRQRFMGFIAPQVDPLGRGYNQIQSTIAVGSGQLFGRGLGRGTQSRLQFLPEYRTDFIFASIAEEMGFLGSILILIIYFYLLFFCLRVADRVGGSFNFLVVIGVFSQLAFQITVNIGMNVGILPITGITLPLISYGGSSLVSTYICLGFVASVTKKV
ncbi:MAG: Rod shape-determining protein RodA [Microgenomates group bacterium Gr01-1014_7]|nr:MAG: Rod shape-determining protein RodA [Microgenomates group bacterium Gr01-1014_7]